MTGLTALLRKELRELVRTFRLAVVLAAFVIIGLGSPLAAKLLPRLMSSLATDQSGGFELVMTRDPTTTDALFQYQKNLGLVPLLVILLAMGSLSGERRRGTAQLVLTKPVSRGAYLLAKLLAPALLYAAGLALAAAGCLLYTWVLFGAVDLAGYALVNLLFLVALWFYLALTLLASALLESAIAAAGVGLAGLALCTLLASLGRIGRFTPGGLLSAAADLVQGVETDPLSPLLASLLLIALCVLAAQRVLRRQEL
jgi:ABC-2 type transport system permease protein